MSKFKSVDDISALIEAVKDISNGLVVVIVPLHLRHEAFDKLDGLRDDWKVRVLDSLLRTERLTIKVVNETSHYGLRGLTPDHIFWVRGGAFSLMEKALSLA